MPDADICFYFDPVCPFAWLTSKWVRMVQAQRAYAVDWRFISLRMINAAVDYDSHFPAGYEAGHTAGLRLLRVAGPASRARRRAGGQLLRCRDPGRDRRGAGADWQGRRDADHPVPAPSGVAFFGPVISRLPTEAQAVGLWDNVLGLASFAGFAELKRSLRERPQLRSFGVEPGQAGIQEDWYAGSRRAPQ
jgi:hypothetical protein